MKLSDKNPAKAKTDNRALFYLAVILPALLIISCQCREDTTVIGHLKTRHSTEIKNSTWGIQIGSL
ncbi:MAG: hypothetical protein E4H13_15570, partial [Calditrichales bacterium]